MSRLGIVSLMLICAAVVVGETKHDWNELSFSFSPLVQEGSANLLPAMAEGDGQWTLDGGAAFVSADGEQVVRLGIPKGQEASSLRVTIPAKPRTLYRLSWRARFLPGTRFNFEHSYPGLHGWLSPLSRKSGTQGGIRLREMRAPGPWRQFSVELFTPAETHSIRLTLQANITEGAAELTDVEIQEERVSPEEQRQLLTAPDMQWAEARRQAEPPAPKQLKVFCRRDPDRVFPYSHPRSEELKPLLQFKGAPGEVAVNTLAVYTPEALEGVRLDTSDAPAPVDWRVLWYHPRRVDGYGRGLTWHWAGDVFIDVPNGVDWPGGRTLVFWLRMVIPARGGSSQRKGEICVVADGMKAIRVPTSLEIYPFTLLTATDRVSGLYSDAGRWKNMTDDQVERELTDIRAHGINVITAPARGEVAITDGRVTGWQFGEFEERVIPMVIKAGFRPPYIVYFGWLAPYLANRLGLADQTRSRFADEWPPQLAEAATETLRLIKAEAQGRGWWPMAFCAVDEPGYWKEGSPERLDWERRVASAAGWDVYCTSSYLPSDRLGAGIKYHCYGGGRFFPPHAEQIVSESHAAGQYAWYYATGSYTGQKGRVVNNRYLSGFIFFKSGADGIMSWTFQRPRGNAYDDFLPGLRYSHPCITYPDPVRSGENLDTPHWEGLCQGWMDFRYCATLQQRLSAAPKAANTGAIRREFAEILEAMPWGGNVLADGAVTNAKCDAWRSQLAALIQALDEQE